jgi:hypothetical protein
MVCTQEKITVFNGKVVCPRCDGNGLVYKATLAPLNKTIFICDECEAMWLDTCIGKSNFQDFTVYVTSLGYTYDQVDVQNSDYDWYSE